MALLYRGKTLPHWRAISRLQGWSMEDKGWPDYFDCTSCGTRFPLIENKIKCNGLEIHDCPFCQRKREHGKGCT